MSNIFLDKYMPSANGEFIKIYLYLLRSAGVDNSDLSICKIADIFNQTEKDVTRALKYWEQVGLISLCFDEAKAISGISLCDFETHNAHKASPSNSFISEETSATEETEVIVLEEYEIKAAFEPKKKHTYSSSESAALQEKEEVQQLLYIAQRYFGRTLSSTDVNTLLYIYDGLEFSEELMEYLIEYCVSKSHTGIRYVEKVALAWAEKGITTVSAAKEDSGVYSNDYFAVLKAFGITGRNPGKAEKDYISKWTNEFNFTIDIIVDACNRTMETIHQPSFQYTDTILMRWKSRGVKSLSDVKSLDSEHVKASNAAKSRSTTSTPKNSFNNFQQRSYNFTELEKELLANNQGGY